ncbi:MFS transporter [Epibacterium ulvae]|uniref:MFS transporter n=1 Tax=Epibacterium ulvae TaxID=1156985 RepID=UPI002491C98C|nr:MFS transporter [Epibacterium ulvae]
MRPLRLSLFGVMLAAAGLPLYIHLPRFASVHLGLELATLGGLLMLLRIIDLGQDPLLGWIADRFSAAHGWLALIASVGLAIGFPLVFSVAQGLGGLVFGLVVLFTAYSLGMVLIYARSTVLAGGSDTVTLTRMASYREAGLLFGVILAALAPDLLSQASAETDGYATFGWVMVAICLLCTLLCRPIWTEHPAKTDPLTWGALAEAKATGIVLLYLVNSLPVALTATLFLFFVEDHLHLPGQAGGFLVLFFLAAAISVPVWRRVSDYLGIRKTLLIAMSLAIVSFAGAAGLSAGHGLAFAVICIASGAASGADLLLLPVMFSRALARQGLNAGLAFGIWSGAGKLSLALAAFVALPLLDWAGFQPGRINEATGQRALVFAYAILPLFLKLLAIGLVLSLPKSETSS